MFESKNARANTVPAKSQLAGNEQVKIVCEPGSTYKVLFVGNSITRHAPKPSIGWHGDWGMAASCEKNDYVHRVVQGLRERYGALDYCISQAASWELEYPDTERILAENYQPARDFVADIVIIRIGENIRRDMLQEVDGRPYFDKMIKFFVSNPSAKVIVTDNFWRIDAVNQMIYDVIKDNGYIYCKLSDLEQDGTTMAKGLFEHEGVAAHPGDYGMQCIAERILACIE